MGPFRGHWVKNTLLGSARRYQTTLRTVLPHVAASSSLLTNLIPCVDDVVLLSFRPPKFGKFVSVEKYRTSFQLSGFRPSSGPVLEEITHRLLEAAATCITGR